VNYRLESVKVTPRAAGSHVTIVAAREGLWVRELVEVSVVDRDGGERTLIWDDGAATHQFDVDLPAGLRSVEIDPRHRTVETAVGQVGRWDDPRVDNRQPRRWRLL